MQLQWPLSTQGERSLPIRVHCAKSLNSRGGLQAHIALGSLDTHVKSVNTFSTNDDPKEVMKNIIIITSFKHWLIIIVKNVKIQSQLVGQSLVPDMSLMIRYSRR